MPTWDWWIPVTRNHSFPSDVSPLHATVMNNDGKSRRAMLAQPSDAPEPAREGRAEAAYFGEAGTRPSFAASWG